MDWLGMWVEIKSRQGLHYSPAWSSLENSSGAPSEQSFRLYTWSLTLWGKISGPKLEYIFTKMQWPMPWLISQRP